MSWRARRPRRATAAGVAVVVVVALASACTTVPPHEPIPNPAPVARTIGPRVVEPDLEPQIDAFFANDFAEAYRNRRAIYVTVDGAPVAKRYNHSRPDDAYDVGAVDSAIDATLVGIAIGDGSLHSVHQTVAELLPAYRDAMSAQMGRVTLAELLTMTAGLPADVDLDESGPGPSVAAIVTSGPIIAPGQAFAYSTRSTRLVTEILAEAVHEPAMQYARERLFGPIGVQVSGGPNDVRVDAQGLARLGQLWLDHGRYAGRQVVPSAWVTEMTRTQVLTGGGQARAFGYGVWLTTANRHAAFAASGLAGQLVEVVPDLDLVAVVQSATDIDVLGAVRAGYAGAAEYMTLVDVVVAQAVR